MTGEKEGVEKEERPGRFREERIERYGVKRQGKMGRKTSNIHELQVKRMTEGGS